MQRIALIKGSSPASTILPSVLAWFFPGAAWFHHELIPSAAPAAPLDARTRMAIWQLGNCKHRRPPVHG